MEFSPTPLGNRFRGYLPVVIDIETAGFNAKKNPQQENKQTKWLKPGPNEDVFQI